MSRKSQLFNATILRTALAGVLGVGLAAGMVPHDPIFGASPVAAQSHGGGGGGQGGGGHGGGGAGGGGGGHGGGGEEGGDHGGEDGDHGGEDGGEEEEGGAGQGGAGQGGGNAEAGGGRPAWAQEGIPEVELGRLSVARSPEHVLDRALAEVLANLTPEQIAFMNLDLEVMLENLRTSFADLALVDSPLQNLALLRELLEDPNALATYGITNDTMTLMALYIGMASDKTLEVSVDTVIAVTTILGYPITDEAVLAELQAKAEDIREAVLEGHG